MAVMHILYSVTLCFTLFLKACSLAKGLCSAPLLSKPLERRGVNRNLLVSKDVVKVVKRFAITVL